MISYRIDLRLAFPSGFTKRQMEDIKRQAIQEAAEAWHKEFLEKHFKPAARGEYDYQPRKDKYQQAKIRAVARGKAEAAFDLVFSGETKRLAMQRPLIRAFPTRARIDLLTPAYIDMRSRQDRPPMGDEMTRVTYQESRDLSEKMMKVCERLIAEGLDNNENTQFFAKYVLD